MALRTFDPGLAYDKATGKGIGSTLAIVANAVDGSPVQTYDMSGNLAPVITNRDGYFGQFQADADRIRIKVASVTMESTNLEAVVDASTAAQSAQAAAEAAAASLQQVSRVLLDTDGVPYFDPAATGTQILMTDADGVPYIA